MVSSEKSWMEPGSRVENHIKANFFKVLGKDRNMIESVPSLNSTKEVNIVKCSFCRSQKNRVAGNTDN